MNGNDKSEYVEGLFKGTRNVRFKRKFGLHRFSDSEVKLLLDGNIIEVCNIVGSNGTPYSVFGKLDDCEFVTPEGKTVKYFGFKQLGFHHPLTTPFFGHRFSDSEMNDLASGKAVFVDGLRKKDGSTFGSKLVYKENEYGIKSVEFAPRD